MTASQVAVDSSPDSGPLFSVIMPCYKMGRFIGDALESVGRQTCRHWELIVVDDCGPDDGTEKIAGDFAKSYPDHRIEFIRHEKNTGVSGARNTAISAAKSEWIAFLDPDDLWMPTYLERMIDKFAEDPEVSVVTSPVEAFHENGRKEYIVSLRFEPWQINQFPASLAVGNFIQPSSTVVRRSAIVELGGFDTDPEIQHIEDYDLWIRLAQQGNRFGFINENLTRYRKHPEAATSNNRRMTELHEFLAGKHAAFFISSHRQFIHHLMRDTRRIREILRNPLLSLLRRFLQK